MKHTKEFKQEIQDLENGLSALRNLLDSPKTNSYKSKGILENIQIQQERIYFFKKGYNFCLRELNAQKILK